MPPPRLPLRIVPLHSLELAARPQAAARLTYRGGPLLGAVEAFTVFWGLRWDGRETLMQDLNDFFDYVLTSPLMDNLAEYGVPGHPIGHGRRTGSVRVSNPDPGAAVTNVGVQSFLEAEITGNPAFPQPGPNTLYFLFLPPGTAVEQGGGSSCHDFCGYHEVTPGGMYYAIMPFADCDGCLGSLSEFDAFTVTASHELSEAVTDPIPGQGWYDDSQGEIGDICAWKTRRLGRYAVQLEWSNRAAACV